MINKLRNNSKLQIVIIQIIFIAIAIVFSCGFIYINRLSLFDSEFHYARLFELSKDIRILKMPMFNLNSSIPYGDAIPTFYPWLLLAFMIPIMYIVHNAIVMWSIIVFVITILGLEIAYFSSKSFYHHNMKSVLFAIIYCISTISTSAIISNCDIGDYLGIMIAPLVIFGWIHWLKNYKWKMMTLGLVLMSFSHILDTVIIGVSILLLTLSCLDLISNKKLHIKVLCKSLIIWILSISIVWVPIIVLFLYNKISTPFCQPISNNLTSSVIPSNITYLVFPYLYRVWTFSDLICLVLSLIYWKHLKSLQKRFIYISIFYIVLNMKWIKIPLMEYTIMRNLQFMYRICFVSHVLLTIVFISIIMNILIKKWYIQNVISLLGVLIALNVGCVYLSYVLVNQASYEPDSVLYHDIKNHHKINEKNNMIIYYPYRVNNNLYHSHIYIHCMNYTDYLPKKMVRKLNYLESGIDESNRNYIVRPKDNGIIKFYIGHNRKNVIIPMVMYKTQKYHLKLDGKYINPTKSFNTKIGYVELHNIHKGWHNIQLIIPMMNYRYIALATSIIGLGLLTFLPNKRRHKENDKE